MQALQQLFTQIPTLATLNAKQLKILEMALAILLQNAPDVASRLILILSGAPMVPPTDVEPDNLESRIDHITRQQEAIVAALGQLSTHKELPIAYSYTDRREPKQKELPPDIHQKLAKLEREIKEIQENYNKKQNSPLLGQLNKLLSSS